MSERLRIVDNNSSLNGNSSGVKSEGSGLDRVDINREGEQRNQTHTDWRDEENWYGRYTLPEEMTD